MPDGVTCILYVLIMLDCVLISTHESSMCVDEVFDLVFSGKAATDYVVRNKTVPSRAECSVLCHQEEGCVSVAYSDSGECVLHSELPQTLTVVSTPDTDIYYRQGAVPISTTTLTTSALTSTTPMPVTSNVTPMTTPEGSTTTPAALTATPPTAVTTASYAPSPTPMVTAATVTPMTTSVAATYTTTSTETMTTATTTAPPTSSTTTTATTTTTAAAATAAATTASTMTTTTTTSTTTTADATTTSMMTTTTSTTTTTTTTTPSTTTTSTTTTTTTTTTTPTTSLTTTTAATSQEVELWVTEVLAYSSQISTDDNAASQVIGEPDVYPNYGHNVKAWAQSIYNYNQYVVLKYAMKLFISEVHFYETYRASMIWLVEIRTAGGQFVSIYKTNYLVRLSSSRIAKLVLKNLPSFTSDVIRVWVDPYYAGGAVEIDAVKLVGWTNP